MIKLTDILQQKEKSLQENTERDFFKLFRDVKQKFETNKNVHSVRVEEPEPSKYDENNYVSRITVIFDYKDKFNYNGIMFQMMYNVKHNTFEIFVPDYGSSYMKTIPNVQYIMKHLKSTTKTKKQIF